MKTSTKALIVCYAGIPILFVLWPILFLLTVILTIVEVFAAGIGGAAVRLGDLLPMLLIARKNIHRLRKQEAKGASDQTASS